MKAFEKVVNPCLCKVNGGAVLFHAYAKIEYDGKRLSISGVVGPTPNGNFRGSCGQCVDEIRGGKPEGLWTAEMLAKFCDVWDRWHLNDMRPYCEHQKELGWDSLATKKVTLYNYSLRTEWFSKQCSLKNHIKNQIGLTGSASITDEEKELWNLPLSVRTWKTLDDPRYEPQKNTSGTKALPWKRRSVGCAQMNIRKVFFASRALYVVMNTALHGKLNLFRKMSCSFFTVCRTPLERPLGYETIHIFVI